MGDRFAAIPYRALSDARLNASHHVLGIIASHDRRSKEGCWASHQTMAKETSIAPSHFSEAAKELEIWGYVTRNRHADGRRWVYRVNYQEAENSGRTELSPIVTSRRNLNVPSPVQSAQSIQMAGLPNRSLEQDSVKENHRINEIGQTETRDLCNGSPASSPGLRRLEIKPIGPKWWQSRLNSAREELETATHPTRREFLEATVKRATRNGAV